MARNKRSVTADLRTERGQDLVRRLVADADVLVENFRPAPWSGGASRPRTSGRSNPRLVVTRVTGFGQTGPYAARAGYGSIGEAMGGIRYVTGDPDRPPARTGVSLGDSLAATFACLGTLVALHQVGRTGQGQVVDSAIYEAVLSLMESLVPEYQVAGYQRERTGNVLPNVAPTNVYPTSDGEMVLVAANQDTVFRRLADVMGRPDLATDARFATHGARGESWRELDGLIARVEHHPHRRRPARPAARRRRARRAASSRPATCSRTRTSPPAQAIVKLAHPEFGDLAMHNVAPRLSRTPGAVRRVGPSLGEHDDDVWGALLGLDADELASLRADGVVRARETTSTTARPEDPMTYRLGVDVGGTFTDILLIDDGSGATYRAKTAITPQDQSVGVLRGIEQALHRSRRRSRRHRRRPARHHRRDQRDPGGQGRPGRPGHHRRLPPGPADRPLLRARRPGRLDHLAQARAARGARGHRRGASGASARDGRGRAALDEDDVRAQLEELDGQGIEALSVSLINSYANPAHEQRHRRDRRRGAARHAGLALLVGAARSCANTSAP